MLAKELLTDLVAIDTIADKDNHQMMDYLQKYFDKYGFKSKVLYNPETDKKVFTAVYGENPAIGFMGHTDTVGVAEGWDTDPFVLTEKDGHLYGLGATDMKGGIAAFMTAIAETDLTKLKRGIGVYCTYDEEIMFDGIKDLVASDVKLPDHVIVAEPTELIPMIGSKGLLEIEFTFTGITSHSSTPVYGKNSNKQAVRFLNRMMDFEEELRKNGNDFFGVPFTTMNIGLVEGGNCFNTVPDKTKVYLDFRICDSEKEYKLIRDTIDKAMEDIDGSYRIINDIASFQNKSEIVGIYEEKTGNKSQPFFGITEASLIDGDRVIIGPGPANCHVANECVSIESLQSTINLYKDMIQILCAE